MTAQPHESFNDQDGSIQSGLPHNTEEARQLRDPVDPHRNLADPVPGWQEKSGIVPDARRAPTNSD